MTMSSAKLRAFLMISTLGAAVGLAAFLAVGRPESPGRGQDVVSTLENIVESSDIVVKVADLEWIGVESTPIGTLLVSEGMVVEVAHANRAGREDDRSAILPVPEIGDTIRLAEATYPDSEPPTELLSNGNADVAVLAHYTYPQLYESGLPAEWRVLMAIDADSGRILGNTGGDVFQTLEDAYGSGFNAVDRERDWRTLGIWAAEYSGANGGPLSSAWQAFDVADGRPLSWSERDARVRSFTDPDVPVDVISEAVPVSLWIKVPDELASAPGAESVAISIRSTSAVVYQTLLSVGSHPISVPVRVEQPLTIELIGFPGGLDGITISRLDDGFPDESFLRSDGNPSGAAIYDFDAAVLDDAQSLLATGKVGVDLSDRNGVIVSAVDADGFASLMDEIAINDLSPSPEPIAEPAEE